MSIAAISPLALAGSIAPIAGSAATTASSATSGAGFAAQLSQGLNNLQATQSKADDLAVQAATGSLTDVHDYMIASTEATLATQLTVAIRNKGLEAFNEIMRMQA
jgi:flagellar hook-basal body complex protein FliE